MRTMRAIDGQIFYGYRQYPALNDQEVRTRSPQTRGGSGVALPCDWAFMLHFYTLQSIL